MWGRVGKRFLFYFSEFEKKKKKKESLVVMKLVHDESSIGRLADVYSLCNLVVRAKHPCMIFMCAESSRRLCLRTAESLESDVCQAVSSLITISRCMKDISLRNDHETYTKG